MRKVFLGVSALSLLIFFILWNGVPTFRRGVETTWANTKSSLYDKEITFSGLVLINEEDLRKTLPLDDSVLSWILRNNRIEAELMTHPLVAKAVVSRCSSEAWNCFTIAVQEWQPRAIVQLKDTFWVVDQKGTFLTPVRSDHPRSLLELPLISGVDVAFSSPDFVKAKTGYAVDSIKIIEKESQKAVERLVVDEGGELRVKFKGMDFTAIFGSDPELGVKTFSEEVRRFKAMLKFLEGKESLIEELDFAYNSQCVVKLTKTGQKLAKSLESAIKG